MNLINLWNIDSSVKSNEVINFMIKLCDPKMDKNGNIETIIDPTMGTGGFLTMSIKYLNDKYKNKVDWTKNKSNDPQSCQVHP